MIKAKCPRCGSIDVENYGLVNSAEKMNELEFEKVLVTCAKCAKFYCVYFDGTIKEWRKD